MLGKAASTGRTKLQKVPQSGGAVQLYSVSVMYCCNTPTALRADEHSTHTGAASLACYIHAHIQHKKQNTTDGLYEGIELLQHTHRPTAGMQGHAAPKGETGQKAPMSSQPMPKELHRIVRGLRGICQHYPSNFKQLQAHRCKANTCKHQKKNTR